MIFEVMQCWFFSSASYLIHIPLVWSGKYSHARMCTSMHQKNVMLHFSLFQLFFITTSKKKKFLYHCISCGFSSAHNLNSNFIIQKNNVCPLFFPNAGNEVLKAEQFLETIIKGAYLLPCFYAFRKTASISYLWMIRVLLLGKEEVVWLLNIF